MRSTAALAALAATTSALKLSVVQDDDAQAFIQYCAQFGKNYPDVEEFAMRQNLFAATNAWIAEANADPDSLATFGHNMLSDMTEAEKAALNGLGPNPDADDSGSDGGDADDEGGDSDDASDSGDASDSEDPSADAATTLAQQSKQAISVDQLAGIEIVYKNAKTGKGETVTINVTGDSDSGSGSDSGDSSDDEPSGPVSPNDDPTNPPAGQPDDIMKSSAGIDWRLKGCVNAVKNQAQCGSCWTFASVAQLEGVYCVKKGHLYNLAEQQLVDCAKNGNNGCNGGYPTNVYNYWSNTHAMMLESDYPYTAKDGSCKYDASKATPVKSQANSRTYNYSSKPDTLKSWMEANGPMAIGVTASSKYFQQFKKGILNNLNCKGQIDHAVAMVGWGHDDTTKQDYWIIRNSWGSSWGDEGYIRMAVTSSGRSVCKAQQQVIQLNIA